jgi:hypothetical protein
MICPLLLDPPPHILSFMKSECRIDVPHAVQLSMFGRKTLEWNLKLAVSHAVVAAVAPITEGHIRILALVRDVALSVAFLADHLRSAMTGNRKVIWTLEVLMSSLVADFAVRFIACCACAAIDVETFHGDITVPVCADLALIVVNMSIPLAISSRVVNLDGMIVAVLSCVLVGILVRLVTTLRIGPTNGAPAVRYHVTRVVAVITRRARILEAVTLRSVFLVVATIIPAFMSRHCRSSESISSTHGVCTWPSCREVVKGSECNTKKWL